MKERPILFSGEMVRAILEGRKTQTRRVIKPQPAEWCACFHFDKTNDVWMGEGPLHGKGGVQAWGWKACPYGVPGDRLWVRETFYTDNFVVFKYRAEAEEPFLSETKWKPSIFMPRHLSRLTLEVVGVRVERLQSITCGDVIAEGAMTREEFSTGGASMNMLAKGTYVLESWTNLWDRINAKRGFGWDKNPWVWVIEFKRLT